jgi:hypothetical protein
MAASSLFGPGTVVNRDGSRLVVWLKFTERDMPYQHTFRRHKTREVRVGDKIVGGDNPIWVQSMTTTYTHDVEATVAEILRMEEAG